MKKLFITFLTVLLCASSLLAAPNTFKVGAVLCLSGACANDGQSSVRALQLAADDINAIGGVLGKKIELIIEDSNEAVSGARAVSAYRKLRLDPSISYFIGPTWAPAGLSLAPVVSKDSSVIMISPQTGANEFSASGKNLFNSLGTTDSFAMTIAATAIKDGVRKVGLIGSDQAWEASQSTIFEHEFRGLGGNILSKVLIQAGSSDIKSEVTRILGSKPEAVMLTVIGQLPDVAKELKRQGFVGKLYTSYIDTNLLKQADGALAGATFATFQDPDSAFILRYRAAVGNEPSVGAAPAYDALVMIAKIVEQLQSDNTEKVAQALSAMNYHGASGNIKFGAGRSAQRTPILRKISADGNITKVDA